MLGCEKATKHCVREPSSNLINSPSCVWVLCLRYCFGISYFDTRLPIGCSERHSFRGISFGLCRLLCRHCEVSVSGMKIAQSPLFDEFLMLNILGQFETCTSLVVSIFDSQKLADDISSTNNYASSEAKLF